MKAYFYFADTGIFTNERYVGSDQHLDLCLQPGIKAHVSDEEIDTVSSRVDLQSGDVVSYQPPQPSSDHEWDASMNRWVLKPDVQERMNRSASAYAQLQALDAKEMRAVSDLLINPDDDVAKDRLLVIRAQKDELRSFL